jgi:hypothetical protein
MINVLGKGKLLTAFDIETLLNLNGEIFPMENGYWTKFEAYPVESSERVPHGIKYSLSLHDRNNERIIGFDNAHAIKPKKKKYGARKITWDHKHKREKVTPYEFETAGQLLEDSWTAVDTFLGE